MQKDIQQWFFDHEDQVKALADKLWHHPESAMKEFVSCSLVADYLSENGFEVNAFDVNGKDNPPNAIVAKYGSGHPVIGFLGEYDALDGLGQEAVPYQSPIPGAGHGCGHNMMGAACAGAAISVKEALKNNNLPGTVIYFGCPAEETVQGKALMIQAGHFDDVDICLAWHPANEAPFVSERLMLANTNIKFRFYGKTAHAAASPHLGRSSLHAAELMSNGVQYMREHIPDDVRIHYVYTSAGDKPNVVPDFAEVHYFIRARRRDVDDRIVEWVKKIAQGAAMMTETTTDYEEISSCTSTKILHSLNRSLHNAANTVGEISFDDEDHRYAEEIYRNVIGEDPTEDVLPTSLQPLNGEFTYMPQSNDIGNVSQIIPTAQFMGLGMVRSLPEHHWSVTALAGSPTGGKVCVHAAKVLAQCAYDLFTDPSAMDEIKEEFKNSSL